MIGFSTGCLYKNWNPVSKEAIEIIRSTGCDGIELCAGKVERIDRFDSISEEDLKGFEYISLHLPDDIHYLNNSKTEKLLKKIFEIHKRIGFDCVVVHPDLVDDWEIFEKFDLPLCVENLDILKKTGKSIKDMESFLSGRKFGMVLDLTHSYTSDSSMKLAENLYDNFADRIYEIHLSGYFVQDGDGQTHSSLFITKQEEILMSVPLNKPVIIESVLFGYPDEGRAEWAKEQLKKELNYVKKYVK